MGFESPLGIPRFAEHRNVDGVDRSNLDETIQLIGSSLGRKSILVTHLFLYLREPCDPYD